MPGIKASRTKSGKSCGNTAFLQDPAPWAFPSCEQSFDRVRTCANSRKVVPQGFSPPQHKSRITSLKFCGASGPFAGTGDNLQRTLECQAENQLKHNHDLPANSVRRRNQHHIRLSIGGCCANPAAERRMTFPALDLVTKSHSLGKILAGGSHAAL